jgi:hypothetical protein
MPCIDIVSLKNRVQTALSSELGTYKYGTDTSDAIKVETGATAVEVNGVNWVEQPIVTGLECVIQPQTNEDFQPLYGGQYTDDYTTLITLKQHKTSDTTLDALNLLKNAIPDLIAPGGIAPRVTRNTALDSIESVQITVIHQIP